MKEESNREIKSVHHHLAMVSRVNMILSIISFVLIVLFGIWYVATNDNASVSRLFDKARGESDAVSERPAVTNTAPSADELQETYRTDLKKALSGYGFDDSAEAEKRLYTVLELRAPAELKNVQLDVVVALNSAKAGNYDDAKQRIADVRSKYAWLAE